MNKLLEITPHYRSFVDDQVLTSGQLNEFINYFEDQDRLSRVCLTGVGIACGFTIEMNTQETEISISQGCGITTDGDLLKLQKDIEDSKDKSITLEQVTYSHFRIFEDENANYEHFLTDGDSIPLWELVADENASGEGVGLLSNLELSDKVALLYLESFPKKSTICNTTNCDNQGQPNIQNLRVLLANKSDVEEIVNGHDSIYTKHNVYEAMTNLPQTAVQKVVLHAGLGGTNNISSYAAIASVFKTAITTTKDRLHSAYSDLFEGFGELLSIPNGTQNTVLNQIDNLDDSEINFGMQYRYDLVRDVSDTFNEIANLLLKLKTECCPDIAAFPKHLLLGCLSPSEAYPELRHEFYHSPINNNYNAYLQQAKNLMQRVAVLLDNFNLGSGNNSDGEGETAPLFDPAITPSKSCGTLGGKAIPFYYHVNDELLNVWDFFKTENYKQRYNTSFHRNNLAPNSWVQTPLQFELDCHDFYRIEGYLGLEGLETRDRITEERDSFGLDFDCRIYDLETDKQAFTAFVREHPSITHRGGVPKGGTFILITESDTLVADFCVSYKVATTAEEQNCCSLMECTYPWISSLKYLNNLSRSLDGTQSNNVPMPQQYRLQVIEYRINREKLINTTTTIEIPLRHIYYRRMHAITDALNKRFDKGLVFDFNESQKRFVITRAKDDTFVLRLRDVTQANSNAIYTYSNSGMFRNNLIFRPDAMRCRDLKGYNPSFYEKLQKQIAPIGKDDDYGDYKTKWASWYYLRDRLITNNDIEEMGLTRMITNVEQLPQEIAAEVREMKAAFRNALTSDVNLNFQLDGDWVNGVWVNETMLDYERQNRSNTHDQIVLFIKQRKELHNETGVTKLSVYITGTPYTPELDAAIEQYNSLADFYFGSPRGENAIAI